MTKAIHSLLVTASLLATGCSQAADRIKIRPIADAAAQSRPVDAQVAFARAQLRMGSPGLALEAFRKAAREQPDNVDAIAGIADAYAAMGRNDLARRYYEAALAVAPHDQALLQAVPPVPAPAVSNGQIAQMPAIPAAEQAKPPALEPAPETAQRMRPPTTVSTSRVAAQALASVPAPSASVTIELPPARPPQAPTAASDGPRLERLSPGEVALVTTPKPLWQAVVVASTRVSTTVRWVPIRSASAQPQVRLLNAARYQGLAASTRRALLTRGWHKLAIGDATKTRSTSVVLYPAHREAAGKMLAAHLGFRASSTARGDAIVVLLGRDAARMRARQLRG